MLAYHLIKHDTIVTTTLGNVNSLVARCNEAVHGLEVRESAQPPRKDPLSAAPLADNKQRPSHKAAPSAMTILHARARDYPNQLLLEHAHSLHLFQVDTRSTGDCKIPRLVLDTERMRALEVFCKSALAIGPKTKWAASIWDKCPLAAVPFLYAAPSPSKSGLLVHSQTTVTRHAVSFLMLNPNEIKDATPWQVSQSPRAMLESTWRGGGKHSKLLSNWAETGACRAFLEASAASPIQPCVYARDAIWSPCTTLVDGILPIRLKGTKVVLTDDGEDGGADDRADDDAHGGVFGKRKVDAPRGRGRTDAKSTPSATSHISSALDTFFPSRFSLTAPANALTDSDGNDQSESRPEMFKIAENTIFVPIDVGERNTVSAAIISAAFEEIFHVEIGNHQFKAANKQQAETSARILRESGLAAVRDAIRANGGDGVLQSHGECWTELTALLAQEPTTTSSRSSTRSPTAIPRRSRSTGSSARNSMTASDASRTPSPPSSTLSAATPRNPRLKSATLSSSSDQSSASARRQRAEPTGASRSAARSSLRFARFAGRTTTFESQSSKRVSSGHRSPARRAESSVSISTRRRSALRGLCSACTG